MHVIRETDRQLNVLQSVFQPSANDVNSMAVFSPFNNACPACPLLKRITAEYCMNYGLRHCGTQNILSLETAYQITQNMHTKRKRTASFKTWSSAGLAPFDVQHDIVAAQNTASCSDEEYPLNEKYPLMSLEQRLREIFFNDSCLLWEEKARRKNDIFSNEKYSVFFQNSWDTPPAIDEIARIRLNKDIR